MCHAAPAGENSNPELGFILHDILDESGVDTTHARTARRKFIKEVNQMCESDKELSISLCKKVDLGRAALEIAAEDDALVSHSSVALPVDAYISRLDDMSMEFASHHLPPIGAPPQIFLMNLERYLYTYKEFRRTSIINTGDVRGSYLNLVLTRRIGTVVMLALIYTEIVKMLQMLGLLHFDIEVALPHDPTSLPRGYIIADVQKAQDYYKENRNSAQPLVLTTQMLLTETLQVHVTSWPMLEVAGICPPTNLLQVESMFSPDMFSLLVDKISIIWQHVACERLVLLKVDAQELRDYSILLYHCGLYEQSFKYLELYCASQKISGIVVPPSNLVEAKL